MPAAGIVLIIGVVLVIGAAAAFLLPTIAALVAVAKGLDEAIAAVGELIAKTEPVEPVVKDINANLDAAVGALEGVEESHLRALESAVVAINAEFAEILSVLPGVAAKAEMVAQRRPS